MRLAFVVIAFSLASCGGQDGQFARIKGRWRSAMAGPTRNVVDLTLSRDGKTITGVADVNQVIYDLDGHWRGPFGPSEVLKLDMTVMVANLGIEGDGTLSTGAEDENVTVVGRRTGRSFQLSVTPDTGESLQISGRLDYDFNDFRLDVEIGNIPGGLQGAEHRDLHLAIEGTSRRGFWNILPSSLGIDSSASHPPSRPAENLDANFPSSN